MASRAARKAPASTTNPDPPPAPSGRGPGGKLRHGSPQTDSIAELIDERKAIRRRVAAGTGLSKIDDDRLRAIDVEIDRLWADLRRERLPPPQLLARPTARPAARPPARR